MEAVFSFAMQTSFLKFSNFQNIRIPETFETTLDFFFIRLERFGSVKRFIDNTFERLRSNMK